MNEDQVDLEYILYCIDKIQEYSQGGKEEFFSNLMVQDAIIRRLSEELKANMTEVNWRNISGFRNILVHDYLGGIDINTVWDVVENDLLDLRKQISINLD